MLLLAIGDLHIPDRKPALPAKFRKLLTPGKISQVLSLGNLCDYDTATFLKSLAPREPLIGVRGDQDVFDERDLMNMTLASTENNQSINNGHGPLTGNNSVSLSAGLNRVVKVGDFRIGLVSGHAVIPRGDPDALLINARQLDVDLLLYGGSPRVEAYELDGKFFIAPGSATGAFSPYEEEEDEEEEEKEEAEDNKDHDDKNSETDVTKESEDQENEDDGPGVYSFDKGEPSFCLLDIQGCLCVLYIYTLVGADVKVDKVSYRKP
ncbi:Metallo-dependent phosphatase [Nadsonia fulvescens var. elongata DSM 6958]|uniref:Vacuolar protein sorting-associated protein 29 n=1 Tax=Nadsonia fulvescens var. elongata DSM 6958 TaxID=857566 RepID=A0A1E3PF02_9ASCO|nr:Metallo-dependent phosphatase [Nadsonia fulvescens var. elongata DSM 6958]